MTGAGSGTYGVGKAMRLRALPADGFAFTGWVIGNEIISTDEFYEFTIKGDMSIKAEFVLKGGKVGDVNVDGFITISDVTALANILLEKSVNGSSLVYADVNKSKSVTISDITPLNNMILGDVSNAKGGYGYSLRRNANYDALLSMDDVQLNAGTATQQSIALDGVYRYVCFQMDIDVPAGIDIQNVVNAEGTDAHIVEWNKLKNGMYRIIGYSHDNASVRDGNLADITFRASADMRDGIYPFHVRNILLGRADGSEVTIDNIKSNIIVGNATSNYELQITNYPQQQSIYDLQGRKLNSASAMKSGLYINNGKKVIKK